MKKTVTVRGNKNFFELINLTGSMVKSSNLKLITTSLFLPNAKAPEQALLFYGTIICYSVMCQQQIAAKTKVWR